MISTWSLLVFLLLAHVKNEQRFNSCHVCKKLDTLYL